MRRADWNQLAAQDASQARARAGGSHIDYEWTTRYTARSVQYSSLLSSRCVGSIRVLCEYFVPESTAAASTEGFAVYDRVLVLILSLVTGPA